MDKNKITNDIIKSYLIMLISSLNKEKLNQQERKKIIQNWGWVKNYLLLYKNKIFSLYKL